MMKISCKQSQSLVFEFIDNTLEPNIKDSVIDHLHGCQECKVYFEAETTLSKLLNSSLIHATAKLNDPITLKSRSARRIPLVIAASFILAILLLLGYFLVFQPAAQNRDQLHYLLANRADHFTANPVDNWIEGRLEIVVMDCTKEKDITQKFYTTQKIKADKHKHPSHNDIKNNGG